jgi:hypothetical protein
MSAGVRSAATRLEDVMVDDPLREIGAWIEAVPGVTVETVLVIIIELPCEYLDYHTLAFIPLPMLRVARLGKT